MNFINMTVTILMRTRLLNNLAALALTVVITLATTTQVVSEGTNGEQTIENDSPEQLASLKGKMVVLEGVIWGKGWPGLGCRLTLVTGQRIYFDGKIVGDKVPDGKAARVHGRLLLRHMRASKWGEPGYGKAFDYWIIENPTFESIEQIQTGSILEQPRARLVPDVNQ